MLAGVAHGERGRRASAPRGRSRDEAYQRFDVEAMIAHLSAAVRAFTAAGDNSGRRWRASVSATRWSTRWATSPPVAPGCPRPAPPRRRAAVRRAGLGGGRRAGLRSRRPGRAARRRRAGARAGAALRRRQPRDQGPRRWRPRPRAGRSGRRRGWRCSTRRWRSPAVRPTTATRRQVGLLVLHRLLPHGRLRARRQLDRPPAPPGPDRWPTLADRRSCPSHCDSVQAALLVELGRWGEAEPVLERAAATSRRHAGPLASRPRARRPAHPPGAPRGGRAAARRQGPVLQALLPSARLHLARGDHDLARAAARRGLRSMGDDRLRVDRAPGRADRRRARRRRPRGGQAACDELARADRRRRRCAPPARAAGAQASGARRERRRRAARSPCSSRRSTASTRCSCRGCAPPARRAGRLPRAGR